MKSKRGFSYPIAFAAISMLLFACSLPAQKTNSNRPSVRYNPGRDSVLNELSKDINGVYGFYEGDPRINRGPCGRFARDFREKWNSMFDEKINIVFAMTPDLKECYHVLVRLPDSSYYDGGNGVMSETMLYSMFPGGLKIDEMKQFDYRLLDKWSYSLSRSYLLCPNYSDDTTRAIIEKHLQRLVR